jgi:hypothetical protein
LRQSTRVQARQRKPPPIEFLSEEFVPEDVDAYELLPDEFAVEEDCGIVFAGPSDAPPAQEASIPTIAAAQRRRQGEDARGRRWLRTLLLYAAAGIAGVLAMERFTGSAPEHKRPATTRPAVASPMRSSAPEPEQPATSLASDSAPQTLWWEAAGLSTIHEVAVGPEGAPSEAQEKKRASQQALEKGKVALSIDLGERAVELDPTDGDSWLILGAAYMQHSDVQNARRCFSSCVKQATRGQRKECAAMLR